MNDACCVMCLKEVETLANLFGKCKVSLCIWRRVFEWIDYSPKLSFEEFVKILFFCDKVKNKLKGTIMKAIWLATTWCLWLKRNAIIFKQESFCFNEYCMTDIILFSWNWLSSSYKLGKLWNFSSCRSFPFVIWVKYPLYSLFSISIAY